MNGKPTRRNGVGPRSQPITTTGQPRTVSRWPSTIALAKTLGASLAGAITTRASITSLKGSRPIPGKRIDRSATRYGYNWEESFDDRFVLSETDALDMLLRVVANGGNLLLMVSPDGSGQLCRQIRSAVCGSLASGSEIRRGDLRDAVSLPLAAAGVGVPHPQQEGERIYCIVRHWPSDGRLVVPLSMQATHAALLGGSTGLPLTVGSSDVTVDLTGQTAPDRDASAVVLSVR